MTNGDRLDTLLAETDEDRRWDLLGAFVRSDTSAARAAGEHALASDDPRTRQMGADVLGQVVGLDRPATTPELRESSASPDATIRGRGG